MSEKHSFVLYKDVNMILSSSLEIPLTMEWKDKMLVNEKLRKAAQESKRQFLKMEKRVQIKKEM